MNAELEAFKKKRAEFLKTPEGKKVTKSKEKYQKKLMKPRAISISDGKVTAKHTKKELKAAAKHMKMHGG